MFDIRLFTTATVHSSQEVPDKTLSGTNIIS